MGHTIMNDFTRLNATIPRQLDHFATVRVKSGAFSNRSEYVRHLIRSDMENARTKDIEALNLMLEKSAASGLSSKTPAQRKKDITATIKRAITLR